MVVERLARRLVQSIGVVPDLNIFCFQVTKDKMLAEKDEELRRMQEMLAQMQVGSGT